MEWCHVIWVSRNTAVRKTPILRIEECKLNNADKHRSASLSLCFDEGLDIIERRTIREVQYWPEAITSHSSFLYSS